MTILIIILAVYFCINSFLVGVLYADCTFGDAKQTIINILWLLLFFIFGCVIIIVDGLWLLIKKIYKRTYVHYAIETFRMWYKYDYKKEPITASAESLKALLQNKTINRMPNKMKNYWLKKINDELERQRKELLDIFGEIENL